MNFNSAEFLLFFPMVLILYQFVMRRERWRDILLLCASYVFYMSWNWRYAGLILLSTGVDYLVGLRMSGEDRLFVRKRLLVLSVVANLGLLAIFKYYNFFTDLVGYSTSFFGLDLGFLRHELLLPVGISFFTFQSMSYTIDLYRKKIECERRFLQFALFVSFFPQLVAGPIVRASHFLPQLRKKITVSSDQFNGGMLLVFRGLFKKIVIADLLAGLGVEAVFATPGDFSSWTLLLALYGYSFQIYNDFSGYSDIAIGAARMMGFQFNINFDRPYLAQNVRDFWTRWHISLSTWLRDYLYISLGGNRASPSRVKVNLMTTMLLGGLWHGAAVNFVLWGGWHGLLLIFSRDVKKRDEDVSVGVKVYRRFLCFHLISVSWLLFRVESWDQLVAYLRGLMQFSAGTPLHPLYFLILALAFVTHFVSKEWVDTRLAGFSRSPVLVQAAAYAGLILLFTGLTFGAPAFIYFQF